LRKKRQKTPNEKKPLDGGGERVKPGAHMDGKKKGEFKNGQKKWEVREGILLLKQAWEKGGR